jgi:hypothetical protein
MCEVYIICWNERRPNEKQQYGDGRNRRYTRIYSGHDIKYFGLQRDMKLNFRHIPRIRIVSRPRLEKSTTIRY